MNRNASTYNRQQTNATADVQQQMNYVEFAGSSSYVDNKPDTVCFEKVAI